jgi:hydroxymethylpyrimidine/phosphomethylpyrimidine kinase
VLSIAGSDSGGGAGIQADLKAFARCGVHGMTAITALTAQSTVGVTAIHPVPGEFIIEQVRAVAEDIGVDAVKIGMLGTAETVRAVAEALGHIADGVPIVIDPVMVAESGAVLLDDEARAAIVRELLPLATVITPNLPEARVLAAGAEALRGAARRAARRGAAGAGTPGGAVGGGGMSGGGAGTLRGAVGDLAGGAGAEPGGAAARANPAAWREIDPNGRDDVEDLARALYALGPANVVVTGGHRDEIVDVFFDGETITLLEGERHPDGAAHGSGCTHSSALAAHLALGFSPLEAARAARRLASEAVRDGHRSIGRGPGPANVLGVAVGGMTREKLARRA